MNGPAGTVGPLHLQNQLLAAMPADVRERLFPHLELVSLSPGTILKEPGAVLQHVYFPVDSIVSLLYVLQDGATVETALVGSEGLIGVSSLLGGRNMPTRALVLSAGFACRLPRRLVIDECARQDAMLQLLLRYVLARMTEVAQSAVCNRRHSIGQQLCRWLLLALDRLPDNQLAVSHETIAQMLGVRREGVTEAAGKLQRLRAIEYRHGHVTVLNRHKLEQLSCECYAAVRHEIGRFLPSDCASAASAAKHAACG